jgi:small subunit ribosomal protein S18
MRSKKYKNARENEKERYGAGETHAMYEDAYKRLFVRKKRASPLAGIPDEQINHKNVQLLSQFISERGRILPNRVTFLSTKNQRRIKDEIKKARELALMPFVKY